MITRRQQFKWILKWIIILLFVRQILVTLFNFYFGKHLLEQCLIDKYSASLEEKLECLRTHRCPQWGTPYTNVSHLILCNKDLVGDPTLLLMTTMYAKQDMFIFNNTLHVWSSLGRYRVHPILFIDSVEAFIVQQKTGFLRDACRMGWTVAMAPLCNAYQFPVFKQLFVATMSQWNATWYGYANGDMLFDNSLVESLDFLVRHEPIFETSMVVGRRYHLNLKVNETVSRQSISSRFNETRMANSAMVDYFLTMKHAFPWKDIPNFVIGRPGYDTWLVWLINAMKMKVVDTTSSIRAVHQVIEGLSEDENSHKTHKQEAGMLYNEDLAKELRGATVSRIHFSNTKNLRLVRGLGYLSCVTHKLAKINKALLKKMVAEAKGPLIEVLGRGQDVLPIKMFEAFMKAPENIEKQATNESRALDLLEMKRLYPDIVKSPARRQLLMLNNTHKRIQSELTAKERQTDVKRVKPDDLGGQGQMAVLNNKLQMIQNVVYRKLKGAKGVIMKHAQPNWYALNTNIPVSFIPDSPDFQYVLIKRTKYFKRLENNRGFKQVFQNLHGACYDNQHIDLEVGDLVIY